MTKKKKNTAKITLYEPQPRPKNNIIEDKTLKKINKKKKAKITLYKPQPRPKNNIVEDKNLGKILKSVGFQRGKSNKSDDLLYQAMLPGKRMSKKGNIYYEYRKNRSDLTPRRY